MVTPSYSWRLAQHAQDLDADGHDALENLGDVDLSTPPVLDDVLTFDGTNWIAQAPAGGGGGGGLERWLVDLIPWQSRPTAEAGNWQMGDWSADGVTYPYGGFGYYNDDGLQNDYIEWSEYLAPGTYTATFNVRRTTDSGIITLSFDGTSVGTTDAYFGANNYAIRTISGIVVGTGAVKAIRLTIATKRVAGTGYRLYLFGVSLRRTA